MDPDRGTQASAAGLQVAPHAFCEEREPMGNAELRGTFYASGALGASRLARLWLTAQLEMAGVTLAPHRIDDALVVLDELVTNVIRHTASGPTVRYGEARDRIVVEVFDRHWGAPRLSALDAAPSSGMGLRIVDVLADAWGWTRTADGRKFVWFEIAGLPHAS